MAFDGLEWADRGLCRKRKDLNFFPTSGNWPVPIKILRLCSGCPVRKQCGDWALRREGAGIWAGMNEAQRRHKRIAQGIILTPISVEAMFPPHIRRSDFTRTENGRFAPTNTTQGEHSMSIEDRLSQEATYWEPEAGDQLIGTVVDLATREGDYGEYPVVTIRTRDDKYVEVSAFRSVLKDKVYEADLSVGDEVGFKYDGEKTSKKGNNYHSYRVVAEHGPGHKATAPSAATPPAGAGVESSQEMF